MALSLNVPESGQLVEVRGRRYAVSDIRAASLPQDPLLGNVISSAQHLITLSSIEDDAIGEELQVIWEREVGAKTYELRELPAPDGFDPPSSLEAFLDAVRWGAASTAETRMVQSPFRSGIDIEDYQLDPVVRAIQMPRANLLIADDVGLGKTIEAGLVAQELILRQRVRRILIVCPSALQIQWQEQMRDKFGLQFRIVNSELMRQLRRRRGLHINPWTHYPRLITSIDYLKRDRALRLMREVLPAEGEPIYPRRFDLLIVDEAHNVAPSGAGKYAVDSQRTGAIRLIEPHFEHKLFLTATPHNGYPESFTALLELLDSQRFARTVPPDRKQLQTVMIRRLKTEIVDWNGDPKFKPRELFSLPVAYTDAERDAHRLLTRYTQLRTQQATRDRVELTATEFVLKLLKKRLFSCPAAFLGTLLKHEESLVSAQRRTSKRLQTPNEGILRRHLEGIEEDFADDDRYEESTAEAIATTTQLFQPLSSEERDILTQLQNWAEQASANPDAKAQELLSWIDANLRSNGEWTRSRVIIFTEYRTTQKWLYEILATRGLTADERLMMLYGGMKAEEREQVKAAFQTDPEISPVRILLATDAASEGLDLQNHCANLIHYEIPWNPNRMEQRNGRIDRHGQRAERVNIFHFVGQRYQIQATEGIKPGELDGDLEFLMRAALKVNQIREDLGKVGPVIATQVEAAMLGQRYTLDTQQAEQDAGAVRQMLKFERKIREQIAKLHDQLQETRTQLRLDPPNIARVVKVGLAIAQQPALIPHPEDPQIYQLPPLKGSWADCNQGLAHPHTGDIRPVTFDPDRARAQDDVVLLHLNHRLVQMCLRLLRAEIWSRRSQSSAKKLHRVTAMIIPSSLSDVPLVIAHGRLVIMGNDGQRLHEEVITAGGAIKAGRFSRIETQGKLNEVLQAATTDRVTEKIQTQLQNLWPKLTEPLLKSLEARQRDRTASLQKALDDRAQQEMNDITAILTELQDSIEQELQLDLQPLQLSLFETEQFNRDRASLRHRLAQIPQEIEQETQLIQNRFANPQTRLFPLAVVFLIPKKLT